MTEDKLLTLREVEDAVRMSRKTLMILRNEHRFPQPIKIGKRKIAWPASVIEAWKQRGSVVMENGNE